MHHHIEQVSADVAEQLCRQITANLPEYFGLPECNEHYALGVHSRLNLAAKIAGVYVGLLSIDFPYPQNSNIYWMGILREYQGLGVGRQLIEEALGYAKLHNASSMTVETLAPSESDKNYLKTYHFYEKLGFKPLFNSKPEGYEWNMVYMAMNIDCLLPLKIDQTAITIRSFTVDDIPLT
jgi:GNAT superfamily N-acetyltransferase